MILSRVCLWGVLGFGAAVAAAIQRSDPKTAGLYCMLGLIACALLFERFERKGRAD